MPTLKLKLNAVLVLALTAAACDRAKNNYESGQTLERAGDIDDAIPLYEAAVAIPESPYAAKAGDRLKQLSARRRHVVQTLHEVADEIKKGEPDIVSIMKNMQEADATLPGYIPTKHLLAMLKKDYAPSLQAAAKQALADTEYSVALQTYEWLAVLDPDDAATKQKITEIETGPLSLLGNRLLPTLQRDGHADPQLKPLREHFNACTPLDEKTAPAYLKGTQAGPACLQLSFPLPAYDPAAGGFALEIHGDTGIHFDKWRVTLRNAAALPRVIAMGPKRAQEIAGSFGKETPRVLVYIVFKPAAATKDEIAGDMTDFLIVANGWLLDARTQH